VPIADAVRKAITAGDIKPGDTVRVPGLMARHGASRGTATRALRLLTQAGWLDCQPGLGYVVPDAEDP
jgi:DNA-binding GntR family transcriptional regulator